MAASSLFSPLPLAPGVHWLALVLPERYKNGPTYANVLKQIRGLQGADGIRLDLVGVTIIGF